MRTTTLLCLLVAAVGSLVFFATGDDTVKNTDTSMRLLPDVQSATRRESDPELSPGISSKPSLSASDELIQSDRQPKSAYDEMLEKTIKGTLSDRDVAIVEGAAQDALAERLGYEEASFRMGLLDAESWEDLQQRVEERQQITGLDYNNELLDIGLRFGFISSEEIRKISEAGYPLPEYALFELARFGKIADISTLIETGAISHTEYENRTTGLNVMTAYIANATRTPGEQSPDQVAANIRKLADLGFRMSSSLEGAPFPLDEVLKRVTAGNVEHKAKAIQALLEVGVAVEDRHIEQIESVRDKDRRAILLAAINRN